MSDTGDTGDALEAIAPLPLPGGAGSVGGNGRIVYAMGATVVTCYGEPECVERFRTASDLSSDPLLLERQLEGAGWQLSQNKNGRIFRCPSHRLVEAAKVPLVYRGPKESPRAPGDRAACAGKPAEHKSAEYKPAERK